MKHNLLVLTLCLLVPAALACNKEEDVCQYADPLVGTADNGHTFPGACVPFGMVQPSPDSGNDEWKYCSGYNIADDTLIGFSQTHLNGTGCQDLGDILLFPFSGHTDSYRTGYDKAHQEASRWRMASGRNSPPRPARPSTCSITVTGTPAACW